MDTVNSNQDDMKRKFVTYYLVSFGISDEMFTSNENQVGKAHRTAHDLI
jgi:hypothetical protein